MESSLAIQGDDDYDDDQDDYDDDDDYNDDDNDDDNDVDEDDDYGSGEDDDYNDNLKKAVTTIGGRRRLWLMGGSDFPQRCRF